MLTMRSHGSLCQWVWGFSVAATYLCRARPDSGLPYRFAEAMTEGTCHQPRGLEAFGVCHLLKTP